MYDPFATYPPPGTMAATSAPQHNQVMPNPQPVASNNALAALYNKHMNSLLPNGTPNGQFPLNPGAEPFHGQMMPDDWRQQFQQARMDWRDARPGQQGFMGDHGDWQGQMQDWRQQRPVKRDYRMGTVPTTAV